MITECLFSSRMSLASLNHHLCHFQNENVFQIPAALRGKTIFDIQETILLENQQFDEKSETKSTSAGTRTEAIHNYINLVSCMLLFTDFQDFLQD